MPRGNHVHNFSTVAGSFIQGTPLQIMAIECPTYVYLFSEKIKIRKGE
jgi:hypothetical protein